MTVVVGDPELTLEEAVTLLAAAAIAQGMRDYRADAILESARVKVHASSQTAANAHPREWHEVEKRLAMRRRFTQQEERR